MPDYRLPLANAQQVGLIPDLASIRTDMRKAVLNLFSELIADNPCMRFEDDRPAVPDSQLNESQRALFGVFQMIDVTPPWDTKELPRMLWAARVVGIGKIREHIEERLRLSGNDVDAWIAAYAADPDFPGPRRRESRFWRDPYRLANTDWWTSIDHPDHLEFNRCAFDFALRRMPELIVM